MFVRDASGKIARPFRFSLRARLSLWMTTIAVVIQLTLGVVLFLYEVSALDHLFVNHLKARAVIITQALKSSGKPIDDASLERVLVSHLNSTTFAEEFITVYTYEGEVAASTVRPAPPMTIFPVLDSVLGDPPAVASVASTDVIPNSGESPAMRVAIYRVDAATSPHLVLVVGASGSRYEPMVVLTRRILLLGIPIGIIAAGIASWLVTGLMKRPAKQLRQAAESLIPGESNGDGGDSERDTELEIEDVAASLAHAKDRITQAFHAKDRFISNVSHELRTPIAVILTEAQTLDLRSLPKNARSFVISVIDEMRRLSNMIESFLTLTKISAGKSYMDNSPCALTDFVMESVASCARYARQHGVFVTPIFADDEAPCHVLGDRELMRVMLDNLIRNAIRFSPEGSEVIVRTLHLNHHCAVSVRDHGPGIAAELLTSIFDPLVQAPSEARGGRGVGLGLSISRTIAELHGAKISVANVPDGGCEFIIELPRHYPPAEPPAPPQP